MPLFTFCCIHSSLVPTSTESCFKILFAHISPSIVSLQRFQCTMVSKLSSNDEMFCCSLMPSTVPIYTPVFFGSFRSPPPDPVAIVYSGRLYFLPLQSLAFMSGVQASCCHLRDFLSKICDGDETRIHGYHMSSIPFRLHPYTSRVV